MNEHSAESHMAEYKNLIEKYHKSAYDYLSEALKIDEECDGIEKKMRALRLYKKGADELKKGLAFRDDKKPGSNVEKVERLCQKMSTNLKMATERINVIELELKGRPGTSKADLSEKWRIVPKTANNDRCKSLPKLKSKMNASSVVDFATKSINAIKKLKGIDTKLANFILDQVLETRCTVRFDDIAGLDNAKQALTEAVVLPLLKPELFTGLRSPVQGILLFGPPGNGKTMLAKAISGESKCVFFNISASALTSKWVGEAEKLVKALFVLARELQPVIIFIDEIDSILCERSDKENEVSRRLKTEFLLQFDGASSSSDDKVLIIGATNRPHDLDDAVLRRFPKRIYVGLPEANARRQLIEKLLNKHNNPLSRRDIDYIARRTENYSNFDLTQLAKEAAMGPVREILPQNLIKVDVKELREISLVDFEAALNRIASFVSLPTLKPISLKRFPLYYLLLSVTT
uniref:microtubule-severing ATPase n=1 Tax=Romanomermis culicivorax TaxID=13658 RepID=A0A915K951_ROMCU